MEKHVEEREYVERILDRLGKAQGVKQQEDILKEEMGKANSYQREILKGILEDLANTYERAAKRFRKMAGSDTQKEEIINLIRKGKG